MVSPFEEPIEFTSSSAVRMVRESVRRLNFRLYLALVFRLLMPTLYKVFPLSENYVCNLKLERCVVF